MLILFQEPNVQDAETGLCVNGFAIHEAGQMMANADDSVPIWNIGMNDKELKMDGLKVCQSHEHIDNSIKRQEAILEAIRTENAAFKERMAAMMAEVCTQLKTINEIKITQVDNMRRREDFAKGCEEKRDEIWTELSRIKNREAKNNGAIAVLSATIGALVSGFFMWLVRK